VLSKVRCPTCRKLVDWQGNPVRPFCSERCRLADLGKWADESYRIPGPPLETEQEQGGAVLPDGREDSE
jgi:endogenous inhibitor of DNA gyrase (YacG/DUF329 family)